jgi:hypothetical protein
MKAVLKRPVNPAKLVLAFALFSVPVLLLSAQAGAKPKAMMSGPAPLSAAAPIEGMITSIEGSTLVLSEKSGEVARILILPDTLILGREDATLESIKPGEALGVAAIRGKDDSLTATVINVFSDELWQRVRKGQWPMASGQIMTNAQVQRVVQKVEGRTIYLKYEMVDAAIIVPPNAEIHRSVTRQLADLKVGAKVSVRLAAGDDGSKRAALISMDLPKS